MHAREEDDAAPSDLNRTVTYRFGQARPGQANESGLAWIRRLGPFLFF
jgi:hypothetical protein